MLISTYIYLWILWPQEEIISLPRLQSSFEVALVRASWGASGGLKMAEWVPAMWGLSAFHCQESLCVFSSQRREQNGKKLSQQATRKWPFPNRSLCFLCISQWICFILLFVLGKVLSFMHIRFQLLPFSAVLKKLIKILISLLYSLSGTGHLKVFFHFDGINYTIQMYREIC